MPVPDISPGLRVRERSQRSPKGDNSPYGPVEAYAFIQLMHRRSPEISEPDKLALNRFSLQLAERS